MFSTSPKKRVPKLSEVHDFWALDLQGRQIVDFFSSLPKITPSLDDTRLEDIQLPPSGPVENINPENAPADRFMDGNNDRKFGIFDFSFPQSNDVYGAEECKPLPTDFVAKFCLNRVFTNSWDDADLNQALTGLDYLSNLECTRKTALREAARRLRINEDNWQTVLAGNQKAKDWVTFIQEQEEQVELCYSCLWVDLRIWKMVKVLQSEPFYKPSVIAMLNTLFPIVIKELPSARITANIMRHHRNSLYRFLVSVESDGKFALSSFIEKIGRAGTGHTWSDTRQTLQEYIKIADTMIKQASQIHGIAFFKILPGENSSLRSTSISSTPSNPSDCVSGSSRKTRLSNDGSQSVLLKASGDVRNPENSASLRSSLNSNKSSDSPDIKFSPLSREKISGRSSSHTFSSQGDVNRLFQNSPQSPWYSSPSRESSPSVNTMETTHSIGRNRMTSFSRPLTPSIEQQRVHRRSSSANRRISYDFRNALPGTPELPSPQAVEKRVISKSSFATQVIFSSDTEAIIQDQNGTQSLEAKKKKSGFSLFRRRPKPENQFESKPAILLHQDESSWSVTPKEDSSDNLLPPDVGRLFAAEQQVIKKKSSFRFLQRQKSRENNRTFCDSNSERTVTPVSAQMVKPKRSLTNLFVNKREMNDGLCIDVNESAKGNEKSMSKESGLRQTIRKARSFSSVRSASSVYSNDDAKDTPTPGATPMFGDDRIITSADIKEPFPFRNFTPLQTPALSFENLEEQQKAEALRLSLLKKVQKDRAERWNQAEEMRRRVEASRQKRKVLRDEMDAAMHLSKLARIKQKEQQQKENEKEKEKEKEKSKQPYANPGLKTTNSGARDAEKPSRPGLNAANLGASSSDKPPNSGFSAANPGGRDSGKPPKTPLKERVIRELANAYSPKSPVT